MRGRGERQVLRGFTALTAGTLSLVRTVTLTVDGSGHSLTASTPWLEAATPGSGGQAGLAVDLSSTRQPLLEPLGAGA